MIKKLITVLLLHSLLGYCQPSLAQTKRAVSPVQVGKALPEGKLEKLNYFQKGNEILLSELRGKPFILDFWTPGCLSCIESLPKLNSYRQQFGGRIEIIMVGQDQLGKDLTVNAEKVYERYKQRFNLDLPVSYSASLFKAFKVSFVPYVIWVDSGGIVKAVTTSAQISSENIQKFLAGEPFEEGISKAVSAAPVAGDKSGPDSEDILYKSEFSKWKKGTPMETPPFISNIPTHWGGVKPGKIRAVGAGLAELFQLAYGDTIPMMPGFYYDGNQQLTTEFARSAYGQYWIKPVLQVADSSLFVADLQTGENFFSYELNAPVKSTGQLAAVMKRDLQTCFGYIAAVEERQMPCWQLVVADPLKAAGLKAKVGNCVMEHSPIAFNLVNIPMYQLIRQIWEYNSGQMPIIDRTKINGHIDIGLEGILTDMSDVKKGLHKYGLDLVRGTKQMKVIVIKDNPEKGSAVAGYRFRE